MKSVYITLFLILLLTGCSKDGTVENGVDEQSQIENINRPPSDFAVEILNVSDEGATIEWSKAIDPENENVTYTIYLNQSLIIENTSELTYKFTGLEELTNYAGRIIAKDSKNNRTESAFTFQTEKYFLKYLKRFDYGRVDYGSVGYARGGPNSMVLDKENNYVIAGQSGRPNGNGNQLFVFKMDYEGNEIWKKFYDIRLLDGANPKIITHSSGYILTGYYDILNLDLEGNVIWSRDVENLVANPLKINSIKLGKDGHFYAVGGRSSAEPDQGNEGVIIKISANGDLLWEKSYKTSLLDFFEDLVISPDNEIYVLGSSETNGATWEDFVSGDSSLIEIDFWVVKTNVEGDIIWENTFGDGRYDFPRQILINGDNVLLAGYGWGAFDISKGRVFEINKDGEEIWNVTTELSSTFSIAVTTDNGFVTTGHVDFGDYGALGIYKFSNSGVEEWNKQYQASFSYLYGHSILVEDDGGYRVAGSLNKIFYNNGEKPELLIYKTDPNGNYE